MRLQVGLTVELINAELLYNIEQIDFGPQLAAAFGEKPVSRGFPVLAATAADAVVRPRIFLPIVGVSLFGLEFLFELLLAEQIVV